ncbi:MAG TPA: phosphonate ABC transporter substrate-binding protein [Pseudolabrys sp.]|nr:phosphonate ABC transporter substrate-binding protein [Pseudolabrys sp.]
MRKLFLIGTAVAMAAGIAATAARAETPEINFGIVSTEASTNLKTIWEPYLEAMAKGTGLKINGFYASDYAGVIEGMRFKKVDVARFGNKSAMEAVNRSNGELFAVAVDSDGAPGYWSHVIVHKDSPLQNVDDVLKCDKSLSFGIGDPNSTSGFLVPTSYIFAARNLDPKTCFKTVRNASHEANDMAVAHKQVDVATSNDKSLRRLEVTAPEARKNIRVIWTSPLITNDPVVWRKDLPEDIKMRLYTWHMSYGRIGTPEEIAAARKILAAMLRAPFNPSNDNQLLPFRILEANKDIMKFQGDDKLSAEAKAAKIAPLQVDIKKYQEQSEKAEHSAFSKKVALFLEAEKANDQAKLKKLIGEFAANAANPPTN